MFEGVGIATSQSEPRWGQEKLVEVFLGFDQSLSIETVSLFALKTEHLLLRSNGPQPSRPHQNAHFPRPTSLRLQPGPASGRGVADHPQGHPRVLDAPAEELRQRGKGGLGRRDAQLHHEQPLSHVFLKRTHDVSEWKMGGEN